MIESYDIAIIGAGPAGTGAALALKDTKLKIALIDKKNFPRNKTCGDAIPALTLRMLKQVLPIFDEELKSLLPKQSILTSKLYNRKSKPLTVKWKNVAYNIPRYSFDNFLLQLVRKYSAAHIYEGVHICSLERNDNEILLKNGNNETHLSCKIVIGCDGVNSMVSKHLLSANIDKSNYGVAVSAYYENVNAPADCNEIFMFKENLPGYFWVFPVGNNIYNVGAGMLAGGKIKFKLLLPRIINNDKLIRDKFVNASLISKQNGAALTFYGKKRKISGERFMLAGDAAHLIDPLFGNGIDKAVCSGILASQHAIKCFDENCFSNDFMQKYDDVINKQLGKELRKKYILMKLLAKRYRLLNFILFIARIVRG